ncbi:RNA helicase [Clostridium tetani]|nr:helicase-related protein [Clostridium tetani]KGI38160.1 RNA helicase [Clostridium tetani]KGI45032.1 RNA helicase [Clostridium tetani]KHO32464.1 RNA helicase [Clostridium tetani]KIG21777.1 RNA helicase [Clostridium tetani]RXI59812.1 RNA helicase [Clostridium tetani]
MKKRTMERNFRKIKHQIDQMENIVKHTKNNALWDHEAAVRKKLKALGEYKNENFRDFNRVYERYLDLLEDISIRIINNYNKNNNTDFKFHEVVKDNYEAYLKSGIMTVLITSHIPKMIYKKFDTVFPKNPKDEYEEARKLTRKFYIHLGETNTGKTYNAMQKLKESKHGIYLSPLRILALENFERLNNEGIKCNLLTGEEEIKVENATHTSCTIEKLDINKVYDVAIIDEIQMIDDDERGAAWTRAFLGLNCEEIHICGAINSKDIITEIVEDCQDEYEFKEYKRDIPLEMEFESFSYRDIKEGDALVVFSKKRVLQLAKNYADMGIKSSLIYGDLPPEVRKKQYKQFINKESSILITTDAIGMGVNLPIRRIIFMDVKKFDGSEIRYLNSQEVKQIAGRAGRKGIYEIGYVSSYGNTQNFIKEMIDIEDRTIDKAVVGPTEAILKIKGLPLREKLAIWSTQKEKIPHYRKMDISEYLIVLDSIKFYKLDESIQWQLLKIPFDVGNSDLMRAFLNYMDEIFIAKRKGLSKPKYPFKTLYELETYYQKINLYYSSSKALKLPFDEEWVYEERLKVSEDINNILIRI